MIRLLLFLQLLAGPWAWGQNMDSAIAAGSKVTYADLLRLICPDLKVDKDDPESATATQAIAIRELGSSEAPKPQEDSIINVAGVAVKFQTTKGAHRVLITFLMPVSGDRPERVLALFDIGGAPKLVDVAGVPQFPDDPGDLSQALKLNDETIAYVSECHHFNSQQGYDGYTILFVRDDRVEDIEDVGLLSCRECASGSFDESVNLSTAPDPGRAYNKIVVQVTLKQLPDPPESEHRPRTRPSTRIFTAEYRWDAQARRFVTSSKELEQLAAFNKPNY